MPSVATLPEYTTIFSQVYSPCGEYLAAGSGTGVVAVWKVPHLLARTGQPQIGETEQRKHWLTWQAHKDTSVYSMASTTDFLLTGGVGQIFAWAWEDIGRRKAAPVWCVDVRGEGGRCEINWMVVTNQGGTDGQLVVAAGDNNVHLFDLETRSEVKSLSGHTDYVHSVDCNSGENGAVTIASGGEDGTVRLWDPRRNRPEVHCLSPSSESSLSRPKFGKYVAAVGLSSDWLACGGGPRLALWHLRSLAPTAVLPPENSAAGFVGFNDDSVIVGGQCPTMYQTSYEGVITSEVETTSSCLYSVAWQDNPRILTCAGSSAIIDVCAPNFNYRDHTLSFPL